jgi:hypothetical protein
MAQKPATIALLALGVGCVIASCAFPPTPATPLIIPKEIQPAELTEPAGQERRKLSAAGNDSDCVLTTGEIHLWCNWITRYY